MIIMRYIISPKHKYNNISSKHNLMDSALKLIYFLCHTSNQYHFQLRSGHWHTIVFLLLLSSSFIRHFRIAHSSDYIHEFHLMDNNTFSLWEWCNRLVAVYQSHRQLIPNMKNSIHIGMCYTQQTSHNNIA